MHRRAAAAATAEEEEEEEEEGQSCTGDSPLRRCAAFATRAQRCAERPTICRACPRTLCAQIYRLPPYMAWLQWVSYAAYGYHAMVGGANADADAADGSPPERATNVAIPRAPRPAPPTPTPPHPPNSPTQPAHILPGHQRVYWAGADPPERYPGDLAHATVGRRAGAHHHFFLSFLSVHVHSGQQRRHSVQFAPSATGAAAGTIGGGVWRGG